MQFHRFKRRMHVRRGKFYAWWERQRVLPIYIALLMLLATNYGLSYL